MFRGGRVHVCVCAFVRLCVCACVLLEPKVSWWTQNLVFLGLLSRSPESCSYGGFFMSRLVMTFIAQPTTANWRTATTATTTKVKALPSSMRMPSLPRPTAPAHSPSLLI